MPAAARGAKIFTAHNFSVNEGNAGLTTVTVTIQTTAPANGNVTGMWQTQDGTATVADNDYIAAAGDFFIPSGQTTSLPIQLQVVGDTKVEADETFSLQLFNVVNGAQLDPGPYTVTIINDDAPVVTVSNPSVVEGNAGTTPMVFNVTLTSQAAIPVQAAYATANGTATAGQDYQAASGSITFAVGESVKSVTVSVIGDTIVEADETLTLTVTPAGGAPATGTGTIINDDVPVLTVANTTVLEGNSGTTPMTFVVTLSPPASISVQATYFTANGTATAGQDYQPASGSLTFAPGETSKNVVINVFGDTTIEPDETLTLTVNPVGGQPVTATGTIINDDFPALTVADTRVLEGDSGTTPMTFVVTLTPPAPVPLTVTYRTADGTATAGQDYQAASGSLTFNPGESVKSIVVTVFGDTIFEPDETLTLTVTAPGGMSVTATGTILNDDKPSLARLTIVSGNGQRGRLGLPLAQPLVVEADNSDGAPAAGVTVQWTVTAGNAQLAALTTITNRQGRASTTVTLNSVGAVEVQASAGQLTPVKFTLASETAFESRAKGPVAVPVGRTLDQVCARNEDVFADACRALSKLGDDQLSPALERVAPQQSGAQSKVASETVSFVTTAIRARLAALRSGAERFSIQHLSLDFSGRALPVSAMASAFLQVAVPGAAGAEEKDYNGWSGFLSGNLGSGRRIGSFGATGFDLDTSGLMFGVDRQFGDAVLGVSLNAMRFNAKLNDAAGSLDTDAYALSIYGSRGGLFARGGAPGANAASRYDGVHVDGSVTVGRNRYDAEHVVDIPSMPLSVARSKNNANLFALSAGTGVEAHHGRTDYDVTLSGTWSRAHIDDLTESGSGPLILFVQGHQIESAVATAGVNVRSAFPVWFGNVLPTFRGEMIHEFKSGARLVTARFLRDRLDTSFTVPLDRPDANYGKLAAGIQAVFPRGWSAYIDVTQDVFRSDLHFRTVQFNLSKAF